MIGIVWLGAWGEFVLVGAVVGGTSDFEGVTEGMGVSDGCGVDVLRGVNVAVRTRKSKCDSSTSSSTPFVA